MKGQPAPVSYSQQDGAATVAAESHATMTKEQMQKAIQQAKKNMEKAVKEMDFLAAAKFRDEMLQWQIEIEKMQ